MITRSRLFLQNAARRLASLGGSRALILLYHRVAEVRPDPWWLAVTPEHFAEHLDILRRFCRPLPLHELAAALANGRIPHGAVVVTFDDGYSDNLHAAKPLLERFEVPATVFVSSGTVGGAQEFWWDALERVFLQPGTLPEALELEIGGEPYSWNLGEDARYSEAAAESQRAWGAGDAPPSARQRIFLEVWRLLQPLPHAEQCAALEHLRRWAGVEPTPRPGYRPLAPQEVRVLGSGGLVEIGAHTVTHPRLSQIAIREQEREIRQSRAELEEILEAPVTSFAYPFGGYEDYTGESVRLVQGAGYACACAAVGGPTMRFADRYQLPRLYMHDMDGERFARLLSRSLHVRTS